jgi:thiol-disulfide isomerase/thioredoxin
VKALKRSSSFRKGALFSALLVALSHVHATRADGWDLKDKDGARYTLSGLQGKWVLVNFWAPWCPPCLQEMPGLDALQQQHKDLQVIGVAVMYGSRKEVTDVLGKLPVSYPIVFGNEDTAGDFGGLDGMPTSFLYSPAGKLVGHHQGILTQSEVERVMAQKQGAATLFTR